jgi:MGS-like domain
MRYPISASLRSDEISAEFLTRHGISERERERELILKVIFAKGYGYADLENNIPVDSAGRRRGASRCLDPGTRVLSPPEPLLMLPTIWRRSWTSLIRFLSGPLGGDQQVGDGVAERRFDFVIFSWDLFEPHPHDVDVKALLRIAVVYNVPIACNRATADFLLSSPLVRGCYERMLPDPLAQPFVIPAVE